LSDYGGANLKAPEAFRTISEASDEIGVAPHVLRFWEGKFPLLKPLKRGGGRRFYRVQDMALLRGLKILLQDEGYTIKGVQKLIRDNGIQFIRDRGMGISIPDAIDITEEVETKTSVSVHEDKKQTPPSFSNSNKAMGLRLRQTLIKLEAARRHLDKVLPAQ
jgi:DNA-binding transcriptional MerR regulator